MMKKGSSSRTPVTRGDVKQMLRSLDGNKEMKKSTDTYSGTTAVAGVVISLSDVIAQGDNINNRVGDVVTMKMVQTTFSTKIGVTTTAFVRFLVFHDRFNLGTAPTVTQVLNTATPTSYYAFANDQAKRFTILSDDVYKLNTVSKTLEIQSRTHKMNRQVHYLSSGAGNPGANSIFAIVLTDATVNFPTYAFDINMRYVDA